MQEYNSDDIHSAALCAWKEARGEGKDGMQAVLQVLNNRIGFPGFPNHLHDVIYGKNQFTSMSVPSDPEFNLQPVDGDEAFADALNLAGEIFTGTPTLVDITNNAHYYANLHTMDSEGWFYRNIVLSPAHPVTAHILHHTFFR